MSDVDIESHLGDRDPERRLSPSVRAEFSETVYLGSVGAIAVEASAEDVDDLVALRAEINSLRERNAFLEERVGSLGDSVDRLAVDEMIDGLLTPQGFAEILRHRPDIVAELREENFGVLYIDVRGVKALNDLSEDHGDELLTLLAERYFKYSLRAGRMGDIITRRGDGFVVVVRNVDDVELQLVADRIAAPLSVEQAVEDTKRDTFPVVASVSRVHASEINNGVLESAADVVRAIVALRGEASARNVHIKHKQYERMWELVDDPGLPPGDERRIADAFIAKFCPQFVKHIERLMRERRRSVPRQRGSYLATHDE